MAVCGIRVENSRLGRRSVWVARLLTLGLVGGLAWDAAGAVEPVRNPRRLAAGPADQLLVADRTGSVIAVDQATLEPAWSFTLPEEGAPFGLASWNRLVFVGNTETHNVEVYRMLGSPRKGIELRFEHNLGLTLPGDTGSIGNPIAIAVDRRAQLVFVLDGSEKLVKVFERKGALVHEFAPADAAGEVLSPVSLAIDTASQELLVGDYGDPSGFFRARKPARILIYDYQGALLAQILGNGSTHAATQFARIQGMAASADGRIFAADPLASQVLVLDRATGELLDRLGTEGTVPGELMVPLDLLLDERTGDLFISNNMGARKIEVLRGAGRTP